MDISVIIVSFNVKYFLEQCLASLLQSLDGLDHEVFVVDNHSSDGSVDYLRPKFERVHFISNDQNLGFARANNQVIDAARGRYILFLNPDTILGEKSIKQTITLLDSHPQAGAAGIRMIDGSGQFLRESKRGFPSAWVAFCRFSGLTRLFPRSPLFAQYYLGNLPEGEDQEAEALSGAYLMIRKNVLEITGGFDERFFMYAEDIDLSYRIRKAGFINLYQAGSPIVHFKGESTVRNKQYRDRFYQAMILFIEKYNEGFRKLLKKEFLKASIRIISLPVFGKTTSPAAPVTKPQKFFGKGDPESISELGVLCADSVEPACQVFCTGPTYSYSEAIEEMMASPGKQDYFFHGWGTRSVVGSQQKNEQGISIPLP